MKSRDLLPKFLNATSDPKEYAKSMAYYIDRKTSIVREIREMLLTICKADMLLDDSGNIDEDIMPREYWYHPLKIKPLTINGIPSNQGYDYMFITCKELALSITNGYDDPDDNVLTVLFSQRDYRVRIRDLFEDSHPSYELYANGQCSELDLSLPYPVIDEYDGTPLGNRVFLNSSSEDHVIVRERSSFPTITFDLLDTLTLLSDTVNDSVFLVSTLNLLSGKNDLSVSNIKAYLESTITQSAVNDTLKRNEAIVDVVTSGQYTREEAIAIVVERLSAQAEEVDSDDMVCYDDTQVKATFNRSDYSGASAQCLWDTTAFAKAFNSAMSICGSIMRAVCKVVLTVLKGLWSGVTKLWKKYVEPAYEAKDFVEGDRGINSCNYIDIPVFMVGDESDGVSFSAEAMTNYVCNSLADTKIITARFNPMNITAEFEDPLDEYRYYPRKQPIIKLKDASDVSMVVEQSPQFYYGCPNGKSIYLDTTYGLMVDGRLITDKNEMLNFMSEKQQYFTDKSSVRSDRLLAIVNVDGDGQVEWVHPDVKDGGDYKTNLEYKSKFEHWRRNERFSFKESGWVTIKDYPFIRAWYNPNTGSAEFRFECDDTIISCGAGDIDVDYSVERFYADSCMRRVTFTPAQHMVIPPDQWTFQESSLMSGMYELSLTGENWNMTSDKYWGEFQLKLEFKATIEKFGEETMTVLIGGCGIPGDREFYIEFMEPQLRTYDTTLFDGVAPDSDYVYRVSESYTVFGGLVIGLFSDDAQPLNVRPIPGASTELIPDGLITNTISETAFDCYFDSYGNHLFLGINVNHVPNLEFLISGATPETVNDKMFSVMAAHPFSIGGAFSETQFSLYTIGTSAFHEGPLYNLEYCHEHMYYPPSFPAINCTYLYDITVRHKACSAAYCYFHAAYSCGVSPNWEIESFHMSKATYYDTNKQYPETIIRYDDNGNYFMDWYTVPIMMLDENTITSLLKDASNPVDVGCACVSKYNFGIVQVIHGVDEKLRFQAFLNPVNYEAIMTRDGRWRFHYNTNGTCEYLDLDGRVQMSFSDYDLIDESIMASLSNMSSNSDYIGEEGDVRAFRDTLAAKRVFDFYAWMISHLDSDVSTYFLNYGSNEGFLFNAINSAGVSLNNVETVSNIQFVNLINDPSVNESHLGDFMAGYLYQIISNKSAYMRSHYLMYGTFPTFFPYIIGDAVAHPRWHINSDSDINEYVTKVCTALVLTTMVIAAIALLGTAKFLVKRKVKIKITKLEEKRHQLKGSSANVENEMINKEAEVDDLKKRLKGISDPSEAANIKSAIEEKSGEIKKLKKQSKKITKQLMKNTKRTTRWSKIAERLGVFPSVKDVKDGNEEATESAVDDYNTNLDVLVMEHDTTQQLLSTQRDDVISTILQLKKPIRVSLGSESFKR